MSDEVKRFFTGLLQKINGLKAIIICDRDGVPLLKLSKDNKFPELGTKQSFLATFSVANEQSCKMMLGQNKSILLFYKSSVIVQMNKNPLIVTFVGSENCNTGHIMSMEDELDKYLEDYKLAVVE